MPIAALCRHSVREAGDTRPLWSRCQTKAPQFAFYFCQLSPYSSKRDRFADYYNTWYRPELMSIIVVGDIDPVAVEKQIAAAFTPGSRLTFSSN